MRTASLILAMAGTILLGGCVLAPRGTAEEQARLDAAGAAYAHPFDQRALPDLPAEPLWTDILHRAFLANGDLEAAYFEWKAAMARIPQAAGWPNSRAALGYAYMFSRDKMKAWDRTTLSLGFDAMENLSLPTKTAQAGKVALNEARGKGARFLAAKFDLQKKVLIGWLDYALMGEKVRIAHDNVDLLAMLARTAGDRVQAGAPQQDLLKAQIQHRLAENDLANMESELVTMRAMLNGMLARPADAPLAAPRSLPAPRPVAADDAHLIAVAVDRNPELAALARDVVGRGDALTLARMAWLPDLTPSFSITGNISKMAGAMVSLPTTIPMIQGAIDEARAMLAASEAMARQARAERGASFVASLVAMRNAERQVKLFTQIVLPKAEQAMAASRQAYSAGSISFIELVDSQRTLLEVRQMIAESRIAREKRLAEMEALAGVDVESLGTPTTAPATQNGSGDLRSEI